MTAERVAILAVEHLPSAAAGAIADALADAVASRGEASLALAGGETPAPAYRVLAGLALPWARVALFFGDERAVPPDDPRSNYRMARETLLRHLPSPPRAVHRMEAEREDRDEAARAYAALLPARLDLLVLGVGEDGHTASLFPGSPLLDEQARAVAPAAAPAPPDRLTITPPVIAAAREIVVLAAGAHKARAVRDALRGTGPASACPARLARRGRWLLDREAAALLREAS